MPTNDHAIDYLTDVPHDQIQVTALSMSDSKKNATITITEVFWNGLKNQVIERTDSGSIEPYHEVIVVSTLQEHPIVTEIIRLVRTEDGYLGPVYHGFITDNPDGTQSEERIA